VRAFLSSDDQFRVKGRIPSLPDGLRIYAIGDIHGRLDLLDRMLKKIEYDMVCYPAVRSVHVFLGDYIDRGPSSRETIDRLIMHAERQESIFLRGNHELIATRCLSDRGMFDDWLRFGGRETLASYGVLPELSPTARHIAELQLGFHNAFPKAHLRFFRDLQNSFSCGDFFFCHAGVRPSVELSQQKESDLLWIRRDFLDSPFDFGKIVVHGHTPTTRIDVRPNRINIDTGAYATDRLTCLVIDGHRLSMIDTAPETRG